MISVNRLIDALPTQKAGCFTWMLSGVSFVVIAKRLGVTLPNSPPNLTSIRACCQDRTRKERRRRKSCLMFSGFAVCSWFRGGSTEFTELMQAGVFRTVLVQKWPGGIVSVSLEGGRPWPLIYLSYPGLESTHRPKGVKSCTQILSWPEPWVAPRGCCKQVVELLVSPICDGAALGFRPEEDVAADRAQPRQDTATCPFGLAPTPDRARRDLP